MTTTKFHELELSQLMLGTVQFGLPYGVANHSGQPAFDEVCAILQVAHAGGVNCLDTAPFYGESEEVLGLALQTTGLQNKMFVASKVLRDADVKTSAREAQQMAEREVRNSLERLKIETLPLCLIHIEGNFRHVEALVKLQEQGLIKHIGCSTATPAATREIIASGVCEAIQIPASILDRRFHDAGIFREAKARGVAVFARSAYLQGLILMEPQEVPNDLQTAVPVLHKLRELAAASHLSMNELALRFVMGLEGLSCVVVGVESTQQMRRNLEIFAQGPLEAELMQRVLALPIELPNLIFEPWRWQKRMPSSGPPPNS